MNIKVTKLCGVAMIAALTACSSTSDSTGGGGTGGGDGGTGGGIETGGGTAPLIIGDGADSGTISASDLAGAETALVAFDVALADGSIAAPTTAPTGTAEMDGYVDMEGENEDEYVVGNLTVNADFDAGTVDVRATDFTEFDFTDENAPVAVSTLGITGGTLTGTGSINSTTITSSLDGTVNSTALGDITVVSTMTGNVYDNGGELMVTGDINGTTSVVGEDDGTIDDGFFYAVE